MRSTSRSGRDTALAALLGQHQRAILDLDGFAHELEALLAIAQLDIRLCNFRGELNVRVGEVCFRRAGFLRRPLRSARRVPPKRSASHVASNPRL